MCIITLVIVAADLEMHYAENGIKSKGEKYGQLTTFMNLKGQNSSVPYIPFIIFR